MSGHSKWANIKHRKAKADAAKGNLFSKIIKEIIVAAKHGGGNPEANLRLKIAIQKARDANIPAENITRAIKRGTGELEGVQYEELVYEGYGPGGVACMVESTTDNRNRTTSEIRYIFSKHGGNLGETGSVAWMFKRRGYISVDKGSAKLTEDELMLLSLEAGAEDFQAEGNSYEIFTAPENLDDVVKALKQKGVEPSIAEVTMVPQTTVRLTGNDAAKMLRLMEALEDHDDVNKVYANFDISEEEMEKLAE